MIQPPRHASWLLLAAFPDADGEAIAGDLHEEFYEYVVPARGVMAARWWFRWQVARSLAPLFFRYWQRVSVTRAVTAVLAAGVMATAPAVALMLVRSFVLSQVPLKTTPELSVAFAIALFATVVTTLALGCAIGARLLARPPSR
jgi:hypothetical protein